MTTTEPSPGPARPADPADRALFDAVATEHGIIYGYGLVSAHSTADDNALVSAAIAEHRDRREAAIAMLTARSVSAPLPASGYQLPIPLNNPTDAANLAVRMEQDATVAWRCSTSSSRRSTTASPTWRPAPSPTPTRTRTPASPRTST